MSVDAHEPGPPASKEAIQAGHEVREVDPGRILAFLALLVVFSAASFGIIVIYFKFLASEAAKHSPRPSPLLMEGAPRQAPEPRLQVDAWGDWDRYKADQDQQLGRYSWVNKDSLIVRLPLEKAMEIVLQRGLPHREGIMPPPVPVDSLHGEPPHDGGRLGPPGSLRMKPPPSATEPAHGTGGGGHR